MKMLVPVLALLVACWNANRPNRFRPDDVVFADQCAAQYGTPFPGTMTVDRNRIVKSRPFALSYGI